MNLKNLPHRRVDIQLVTDPETGKHYVVATALSEVHERGQKPNFVADVYVSDAGDHETPAVRYGTKILSQAEFTKEMEEDGMELLALMFQNLPDAIKEFENNLAADSMHSH